MKYLHFPELIKDTPIRLNSEERDNPNMVVAEFFAFYNLNAIRTDLENWLEYALSSDDEDLKDPINRVNLVQFKYQLEAFVEANYLIYNKAIQKTSRGR